MTLIEAIFLGIVQGATEFLPVSSSGHTLLMPSLLRMPEPSLSLITIGHQGTLLAVFVYFWRDLWAIATGVIEGLRAGQPLASDEARLGWYVVVGSIPAAVAGLTLEDFFESVFGEPIFAAALLLATAGLLVAGERLHSGQKELAELNAGDAIIVGLFQMLALMPGISRSGSTITGGLWRGLDRATSARFSFLLGIPAILGAGMVAVLDIFEAGNVAVQAPVYLATFLAAAITGYACIHFLLTWLRQHSLYAFAAYCAGFGLLYLLLAFLGAV